jgi:hypothetical protein
VKQFTLTGLALAVLAAATGAMAQPAPVPGAAQAGGRGGPASWEPRMIRLWDGTVPGAVGTADADTPVITY